MTSPAANILLIGPSWVGDMVMAQSLVQTLQESAPNSNIDILAPVFSGALIQRMPGVRRHIMMPLGHGELGLRRRRSLGLELRVEKYRQAIVLPNSLKSALVPWFANIPLRTGWRGEWRYGLLNDVRVLDSALLPQMTQRFVALGVPCDVEMLPAVRPPQLQANRQAALGLAQKYALAPNEKQLALCPGAEFGGAKRWPVEHFVEVADAYLQLGWQVALYGSANDASVCAQIHKELLQHPRCLNLAGKTSLCDVVDMLSLATAVVSNDSGLMHIAAALGRPLVALYGPTSSTFTPPLHNDAVVIATDIECAPCFERECPLGHQRCMRDISPQQVLASLDVFSEHLESSA